MKKILFSLTILFSTLLFTTDVNASSFNANIVIEIHACNGSFSGNATKWLIWQSKATKNATIAT